MCSGFSCSKASLVLLNFFYLVVAVVLIAVGGYAKGANKVTSLSIYGGIIAAGVFLMLVAVVGIVGAIKHHQVTLFFYMIILFLVFLIQFFVAIACLAMNQNQRMALLNEGWKRATNDTRADAERAFSCCGFCPTEFGFKCIRESRKCAYYKECFSEDGHRKCSRCDQKIEEVLASSLRTVGGVGLFFSFSEIAGVWISLRYRNQKDPQANPNQFL